jgi:hypothetical protein
MLMRTFRNLRETCRAGGIARSKIPKIKHYLSIVCATQANSPGGDKRQQNRKKEKERDIYIYLSALSEIEARDPTWKRDSDIEQFAKYGAARLDGVVPILPNTGTQTCCARVSRQRPRRVAIRVDALTHRRMLA